MSGAMSQVWGMINGLQIITQLPLFDAKFPDLSESMITSLIDIATFDVMPSDEVFEFMLSPPDDALEA